MKKILFVFILYSGLIFSTQSFCQTSTFIKNFKSFVESVEKKDSIPSNEWENLNSKYEEFRAEYKVTYKNKLGKDDKKMYNELKTRYIKQVSIKKVGGSIKDGINSTTGYIKGIFKKTDKKKD